MKKAKSNAQLAALRSHYEAASALQKRIAHAHSAAILAVRKLVEQGHMKGDAREAVAAQLRRDGVRRVSAASLCRWEASVRGHPETYWPAVLIPRHWGTDKRIAEATRSAVVASLIAGEAIMAVARRHGISSRTVARYADESGITRTSPKLGQIAPLIPQATKSAILADLLAGRTRTATAAFHGVSRHTVQMLARGAGLTRPRAARSPATESAH